MAFIIRNKFLSTTCLAKITRFKTIFLPKLWLKAKDLGETVLNDTTKILIKTLLIKTLLIKTLLIKTLLIKTLLIKTLLIKTLCKKTLLINT
jgi:hypothetical protein